jgi:hypothetical protein
MQRVDYRCPLPTHDPERHSTPKAQRLRLQSAHPEGALLIQRSRQVLSRANHLLASIRNALTTLTNRSIFKSPLSYHLI